MTWYLPITIIPGIGMLILSTSTQMLSVSEELRGLLSKKCTPFEHDISRRKLLQLGLLTRASALLYTATGFYVLSGILGVIIDRDDPWAMPSVLLYIGTMLAFVAIILLIAYAFRAVKIRRLQFDNNQHLEDH